MKALTETEKILISNCDKIAEDSGISKTSLRQEIEYRMGKGKVISEVLDKVEKYAKTDQPVLIEGATGTGKELIANYLCRLSSRKKITVNCGSLSRELANSELFGSVKGAFTDARDTKGKVEAADGGILFLDEFNSLPLDVQANLLRLIEHNTFTKVGDIVEHKANVRIIAAGNKSFKESVTRGELRLDLYERFIKTIYVPTLKERIEDIDYFIDRFIAEENKALGKNVSISNAARNFLINCNWPGNVRQLKNFITTLIIEAEMDRQSKKYVIQPQSVRECFNERCQNNFDNIPEDDYTLQTAYDTAEKKAILRALDKTGGNNEKAIELLGVSHGNYYNLKKKLGI
jgi:transcriptional regulator with PAS, ATPase and Fis domain